MVKSNLLSLSVDPGGDDCIVCKLKLEEVEKEELMSTNNNTKWAIITINIMLSRFTGLTWKCSYDFIEKLC